VPLPPLGRDGLEARTVLYVGGYPDLAPYLRRQVELLNGRFLHHDGVVETHPGDEAERSAGPDLVR
jgi:hypothetical protein